MKKIGSERLKKLFQDYILSLSPCSFCYTTLPKNCVGFSILIHSLSFHYFHQFYIEAKSQSSLCLHKEETCAYKKAVSAFY